MAGRSPGSNNSDQLTQQLSAVTQSLTRVRETIDARQPFSEISRALLNERPELTNSWLKTVSAPRPSHSGRASRQISTTLATYNRMRPNWNAAGPVLYAWPRGSGPAYTVSDSQMRTLLSRDRMKIRHLQDARWKRLSGLILRRTFPIRRCQIPSPDLRQALGRFRQSFDGRRSSGTDATDLLTGGNVHRSVNDPQPSARRRPRLSGVICAAI